MVDWKVLSVGPGATTLTRMFAGGGLLGHHLGHADERMLGGGVGHDAGVGRHAHDAGGDDDAAPVVHQRQTVLAGQERAPDVDGHDLVEDLFGILRHRREHARDAGMAEDDVDLAPAVDGLGEVALGVFRAGDVGADGADAVGDAWAAPPRVAAAALRLAALLPTSMTLAPSCTRSAALARPMLPAPPVTTHVLPVMMPTLSHPFRVVPGRGGEKSAGAGSIYRASPVYGMPFCKSTVMARPPSGSRDAWMMLSAQ